MTAVGIDSKRLKVMTCPVPEPGETDVLLKVAAAGVNRPDILQREGLYPPPPGVTDIPGLEVAGEIVKTGQDVSPWRCGDFVCALVPGGGYAEYCVAPAALCLPVPSGFSMVAAASLPETFFTVWSTIFDMARFIPGETVLVHGGSSGIGTTAIQLVTAFGGQVFVTCGTGMKCRACRELGASLAVNYREQDFVEILKNQQVHIVLDMVGGDYVIRNLKVLTLEGRHVSIAMLRGRMAKIDLALLLTKRLTLYGATLRARPVEQKARIAEALKIRVWPLLESGTIKPVIYHTFPLTEAHLAHQLMESGTHVGKIVLIVDDDGLAKQIVLNIPSHC